MERRKEKSHQGRSWPLLSNLAQVLYNAVLLTPRADLSFIRKPYPASSMSSTQCKALCLAASPAVPSGLNHSAADVQNKVPSPEMSMPSSPRTCQCSVVRGNQDFAAIIEVMDPQMEMFS